MDAAFITSAPTAGFCRSSRFSTCTTRRPANFRYASVQMCDESLSAAEKTRRALSETKPLVKFRRETDFPDEEDTSFSYTKGVDKGIDIWLVVGILTFLVPVIGFAWGVANGIIDVNPR